MLIQTKIIASIALIMALIGIHYWDKESAIQEVRQEYIQKAKLASKDSKATEKQLKEDARSAASLKDEQIKDIDRKLSDALVRLSKRPSRSSPSPAPRVEQACTGRELYREDGQFLRGEASRAESLIVERDFYYERYEEARKEINEYRNRQREIP